MIRPFNRFEIGSALDLDQPPASKMSRSRQSG
jgi:hypothetical protein